MKERWRAVPGYEGHYEVSDRGDVKSLDRTIIRSDGRPRRFQGRMLKPRSNGVYLIEKQLGYWESPNIGSFLGRSEVTPAVLYKKITSGKRRLDTLTEAIKRCCQKNKGKFKRLVIQRGSVVRLLGFRPETAEEVKRRLDANTRRGKQEEREIQRHRRLQLALMLTANPDVVRRALKAHDRKQAAAAVAADPGAVRATLVEKKK